MKSPLKDNPLHNPGETLDKEIDKLINDDAMSQVMLITFLGVLTILEWVRWWMELPYSPYIYTLLFLVLLSYSLPKIFNIRKQLKALRLGRDGEKAVGQYLESLRANGAKVFHDIPGQNFNLDHVVIASSGIYVIETKTYSKPEKGRAVILFNGTSIRLNNLPENNKPIIQVSAAASWLKSLLQDSTGKQFVTKPVVVFPGWFIEPTSEAKNSLVWVLNPKALPTFISKSKSNLSDDEINMASFHLSRYIRSYKEKQ
jgi:hypothetical protein